MYKIGNNVLTLKSRIGCKKYRIIVMNKNSNLKIFFSIIFFICFFSICASNIENYIYTSLPSNKMFMPNANCIYKEKRQYVWIGTSDGIYRFDGAEYKRYEISVNGVFRSCTVKAIFVDKKNDLWFVSNFGVGKYYRNIDKFFVVPVLWEKRSGIDFNCYSIEEDGIYFGVSNGILKYDYETNQINLFHEFSLDSPFYVKYIKKIDENKILVSDQYEILLLDYEKGEYIRNFITLPSKASCFHCDNEGNIWVATFNNGLKCFDSNGKLLKSFEKKNDELNSEVILCIEEKDSLLWMGTDGGGINILNKKDDSIRLLEHIPGNANSLPSNSIKSLHIDDYGMVWAGSVRDGIISIQKGKINTYQEVNLGSCYGLSNPSVISLFQETGSSYIWIGTDGEGINKFDLVNKTFKHYPSTFNTKVASIANYSDDELILSLYLKGFFLFNKKTGALKKFDINNRQINNKALFSETTVNIENEGDDNLLFMSDRLFRYNKRTEEIKEIKIENQYRHLGYFLLAGRDDKNIFLYDDHAVYRLENNSDSLIRVVYIASEMIMTTTLDNENCLWLATNKGFSKFNIADGTRNAITDDFLLNISSIVPDNNGTIWIGMENRLYAYLKKENSFAIFGSSEGVLDNEYLKKSNLLTNNGIVCMGGARGLLVIDRDFKIEAKEVPEVKIAEIKIDGVQHVVKDDSNTENLEMAWDSKSLELSVMSLERDILRPKNFRFEIIGANPMVVNSSKPVLRLNSLLPGKNSIFVSCSTRNGLWTRPVELLTVDVLPPWYRTWWFMLSCVFWACSLIMIIFFSILRRKNNAMKMALKEHEKNVYEEKVRFLINMSHELRTPLTLIHAPLKRILQNMKNDDVNFVALSKIYRQSGRMKKLLNMVLDLRKMEMGENTVHLGGYNFNDWLKNVVDDFVSEGEAMGINIHTELDEKVGEVVFDKEKIEVVLTNLLVNAMKHSERDSEVIIKTELVNEGKDVKISVIDKGAGLDNIELNKLFTRFYQGNNEKYGTGIGLSYSKVLVELHNGSIGAVNNEDGRGATFFFCMPVDLKKSDINTEERPYLNEFLVSEDDSVISDEKNGVDFSIENEVLLFVDDSSELQDFVVESLNGKFKTILTASNGIEALNVISRNMPSIIVSDVMMPEMDGYELCSRIKKNKDMCHIPVILLTARDDEHSKKRGYEVGADTYISKPFDIETLLEVIKGLLRNRRQTKQFYMNFSAVPEMENKNLGNADEIFIKKLNEVIKENISNPDLDINLISASIGMSRTSFYNKLKSVTDVSGSEYINRIRLEYAMNLIKSTDLSFTEISEMSGFTSSKYFSTIFKQYIGMTPTQFRSKEREA